MKKIITKVFVAFMLISMMTCTAFANGLVVVVKQLMSKHRQVRQKQVFSQRILLD